jgi:hypothetical protein
MAVELTIESECAEHDQSDGAARAAAHIAELL